MKYIFKTIRFVVLGAVFFMFSGLAVAAPMLAPIEVNDITETSATLLGYVSSPNKSSVVWFELSNDPSMSVTAVLNKSSIYYSGFFRAYPSDLKRNTKYYYRAGAMGTEGEGILYSSVASFKTAGPVPAIEEGNNKTRNQENKESIKKEKNTTQSNAQATFVQSSRVTQQGNSVSSEGFIKKNKNTALVLGVESQELFPQTLIGWVALFVLLLVIILIISMIYESSGARNKAKELH